MSEEVDLTGFSALVHIIAELRSPQGCPWDREQTHSSLIPNLREEYHEVMEALNQGDSQKLCEELGDLLMQILLHAQIAAEEGSFDIDKVIEGISAKLIRRHPHVFGRGKVANTHEVVASWESIKQKERGEVSLLSSLPAGMPALAGSQTIQHRVARVGFDWKVREEIIEKLVEEVKELQQSTDHQSLVEEFGDLLFTLANIARRWEVDLEEALRLSNERFCQRFSHMEKLCHERGIPLTSLSLEQQNALWEEAKRRLSPHHHDTPSPNKQQIDKSHLKEG